MNKQQQLYPNKPLLFFKSQHFHSVFHKELLGLGNKSKALYNFSKACHKYDDIDSAIEMTILDEHVERLRGVRMSECDDQKLRIAQCFANDKSVTKQAWEWYSNNFQSSGKRSCRLSRSC